MKRCGKKHWGNHGKRIDNWWGFLYSCKCECIFRRVLSIGREIRDHFMDYSMIIDSSEMIGMISAPRDAYSAGK